MADGNRIFRLSIFMMVLTGVATCGRDFHVGEYFCRSGVVMAAFILVCSAQLNSVEQRIRH